MSALHEPPEDVQSRLGALASVAAAVSGAHELGDVLEIAAEQILAALDVSSVSISRWHLAEGLLQTLINSGELGPGEERLPAYETYDIAKFPLAHAVLRRGEPHVTSLDDDNADEAERELLRALGKVSCAAVPIVYDRKTWGEIYVAGAAALTPADLEFLQEICAQLALAIGRAERFSELLDAAYRDALTSIGNRRAFDEHLARSLAPGSDTSVSLLLGDVDGLKGLNDGRGHAVGDHALRLIGTVLTEVCGRGTRPARIGGDEFAVIIVGAGPAAADALVADITRALTAAGAPVGVSWGAAHSEPPHRGAAELTRAADLAQYATKRRAPGAGERTGDRRAARRPSPSDADRDDPVLATVAAALRILDQLASEPPLPRCIALAELIADASRSAHWWITTTGDHVVARSASAAPVLDDAMTTWSPAARACACTGRGRRRSGPSRPPPP